MHDAAMFFVRAWAFFRKEVAEILRQPRLVVSLVLAPFLILALFGAGYRQSVDPLRTIFVAADDAAFESAIGPRLGELEGAINYLGVTSDRSMALSDLRRGSVDVVVIVPEGPVESVRDNQRAIFEVVHDKLDPYEQATIGLITDAAVDAVNRSILEEMVAAGQDRSDESSIAEARALATALREAMEKGDRALATDQQRDLGDALSRAEQESSVSAALLDSLERNRSSQSVSLGDVRTRAGEVDVASNDLAEVRQLEEDLIVLDETLGELRAIEPEILVSPFGADSDLVGSLELGVTDFYAPGVIALLLQHLAITFAGLSLVRERALGTTEVFRVAPLGASQMLLGKYLGYIAVATIVSLALSALMFLGFGVPFVGSVGSFALVLALLVVASLGVGFVISSIVSTDTQAVNASMIVLLLSIFFSGFFLSLDRLLPQVRLVSWALPITHALDSMRDVLFRGSPVDLRTFVALGGGSIAMFALATILSRRRLAAQ